MVSDDIRSWRSVTIQMDVQIMLVIIVHMADAIRVAPIRGIATAT